MRKKVIISIFVVLLLIVFGLLLFNKTEEKVEMTDGLKFKNEYESLNGLERESDPGNTNPNVAINSDNPIKYSSIEEAIETIKNGTGVLYFGFPDCPWCRNAIPVMLDAADEKGIKEIKYIDMSKARNTWKVVDGKATKVEEEADGYYDLLKALDKVTEEYYITDENGKEYDTKEKRLFVPMVLVVKDSKITGQHLGTVDLNKDQTKYDPLTKEQQKELLNIYEELFDVLIEASNSCSIDSCD